MVDSWDAVLQEYGRLSLSDVLEPAITYAESGFPFFQKNQHVNTLHTMDVLAQYPETAAIFPAGWSGPAYK
ncbi:hypothetical protein GCM10020331_022270 [Ectobacillus funiculus]